VDGLFRSNAQAFEGKVERGWVRLMLFRVFVGYQHIRGDTERLEDMFGVPAGGCSDNRDPKSLPLQLLGEFVRRRPATDREGLHPTNFGLDLLPKPIAAVDFDSRGIYKSHVEVEEDC